jgi:hypothetical protein
MVYWVDKDKHAVRGISIWQVREEGARGGDCQVAARH